VVPLLSEAPGALETVRALLNTRWSPRRGEPDQDTLEGFVADSGAWTDRVAPREPGEVAELRALRADVREALTRGAGVLEGWLERYPVRVRFNPGGTLDYRPADDRAAPVLLAVITEAVASGTWRRLKACPECAWVFYDHSRNATRAWCGMAVAGPNGRSCGAAAKMRAYRARQSGRRN
jgi:hypothetical protein